MTLFLDSSALAKRYILEPGSEDVVQRMALDTQWTASDLALAETLRVICRTPGSSDLAAGRTASLRADWRLFDTVPVDAEIVERAAEIACTHGMRTLDAIHLAAVERLPGPLTFLTFDQRQAAAARMLGFSVAP